MVESGTGAGRQGRAWTGARRGSALYCERCGMRYAEGAVARESTLLPGVPCRRCGGTLTAALAEARDDDAPVLS